MTLHLGQVHFHVAFFATAGKSGISNSVFESESILRLKLSRLLLFSIGCRYLGEASSNRKNRLVNIHLRDYVFCLLRKFCEGPAILKIWFIIFILKTTFYSAVFEMFVMICFVSLAILDIMNNII